MSNIVPPSRLEILDNVNNVVWNSTLPPVMENELLEITCKAYDGMYTIIHNKKKKKNNKQTHICYIYIYISILYIYMYKHVIDLGRTHIKRECIYMRTYK